MATNLKKRDRSPLPERAMRVIRERDRTIETMQVRFRVVISRIASAADPDYVQRLARTASSALEPGSVRWAQAAQMLKDSKIRGFCQFCGLALKEDSFMECPFASAPCTSDDMRDT